MKPGSFLCSSRENEDLLSPTVSDLQDRAALCFLFCDVRCFGATSTGKETCMDGARGRELKSFV